jgi:hypothetical protein
MLVFVDTNVVLRVLNTSAPEKLSSVEPWKAWSPARRRS